MNQKQINEKLLEAFKASWIKSGESLIISGEIMPREKWAPHAHEAIASLAREGNLPFEHAALAFLFSPLSNSSALGSMLKKEGFLKEGDAGAIAGDYISALLARKRG